MRTRILFGLIAAVWLVVASVVHAAGIFTLRGKLRSFNEATYEIESKSMIYEIKKSGLPESQVAEMKTKKTGQDVELVVTTEAVAKVRDSK